MNTDLCMRQKIIIVKKIILILYIILFSNHSENDPQILDFNYLINAQNRTHLSSGRCDAAWSYKEEYIKDSHFGGKMVTVEYYNEPKIIFIIPPWGFYIYKQSIAHWNLNCHHITYRSVCDSFSVSSFDFYRYRMMRNMEYTLNNYLKNYHDISGFNTMYDCANCPTEGIAISIEDYHEKLIYMNRNDDLCIPW